MKTITVTCVKTVFFQQYQFGMNKEEYALSLSFITQNEILNFTG